MEIFQIESLHRKYAPSPQVFETVFTHCHIVWEIAGQLIRVKNLKVQEELVMSGALLHDIGAYTFIDVENHFDEKRYIRHGIEGYKILKEEGLPEELCRIAERHTGVGITKRQIINRNLPLPLKDYTAETIEEQLIMYADKFHSKNPQFNSFDWYRAYTQRFGEDTVKKFEEFSHIFGIPELESLSIKYRQPIV